MVETIKNKDSIIAVIISGDHHSKGTDFLTPKEFSQQLAFISRKKGESIPGHFHNKIERNIFLTQETLFIKSGEVKVNFYDYDKNYLGSRILKKGDVILLASGGHGFEFMEDTEIIEVKQGHYLEGKDKVIFKNYGNS